MRDVFQPCVYLLASRKYGTLYCGVTTNLIARMAQHRDGATDGFTQRYDVKRLVWFEQHERMESAIMREKRIKKWNRAWKIRVIEEANPEWRDLLTDFGFEPRRMPTTTRHPRAGGDPADDLATANRREMDSRLRGNDDDE